MRGEPELVLEYWRCCSQHNWYSVTYNISYLGTKTSCEAARKGTIKDGWICLIWLIWSDPNPHDSDQYSGTFFWLFPENVFPPTRCPRYCVLYLNQMWNFSDNCNCCVCLCVFWKTEVNCLCFNYIHLPLDAVFFMTIYSILQYSHCLIVRHCRSSLFLFHLFEFFSLMQLQT